MGCNYSSVCCMSPEYTVSESFLGHNCTQPKAQLRARKSLYWLIRKNSPVALIFQEELAWDLASGVKIHMRHWRHCVKIAFLTISVVCFFFPQCFDSAVLPTLTLVFLVKLLSRLHALFVSVSQQSLIKK